MYEDRCLICGETVPEGRDVCPDCMNRSYEAITTAIQGIAVAAKHVSTAAQKVLTEFAFPSLMRVEDIRRVLVNYIRQMPRAYRRRNANATVVRDIILKGTGYAGFENCCTICEAIGCDPMAYEFPEWSLEDMGGRKEVRSGE